MNEQAITELAEELTDLNDWIVSAKIDFEELKTRDDIYVTLDQDGYGIFSGLFTIRNMKPTRTRMLNYYKRVVRDEIKKAETRRVEIIKLLAKGPTKKGTK